jgi:hypothetical protein
LASQMQLYQEKELEPLVPVPITQGSRMFIAENKTRERPRIAKNGNG